MLQLQPTTEEEARGYMNVFTFMSKNQWVPDQRCREGMHGAALSAVPGIERHELALAASSGTMIDGMLSVLLDIGSNVNIIG
eukprot:4806640-Pyramimonas_sp.AAC.1